ncbi:unnamed protein product [Urochloa humidicola]
MDRIGSASSAFNFPWTREQAAGEAGKKEGPPRDQKGLGLGLGSARRRFPVNRRAHRRRKDSSRMAMMMGAAREKQGM